MRGRLQYCRPSCQLQRVGWQVSMVQQLHLHRMIHDVALHMSLKSRRYKLRLDAVYGAACKNRRYSTATCWFTNAAAGST
jgi:hypothetical protein